ncbi:MAG: primosomal protein N' [Sulfurimonas sp.]|uniref:primosomal protein N' n=1 Tax=Sulfurimonas sp. TaxID=2022749 RepID=UPI002613023E|nr:primosomal protein N' [Sulfurimonas sp.]MDD5373794.1 primosomal protein N' [Sulfurimonas sp.]
MNYYNIALINSPLEPFTYQSLKIMDIGTKVKVKVRNREVEGIVIAKCDEPIFECLEILEIYNLVYSTKQLELGKFISAYYFCSLGEAVGLMLPFESNEILNLVQDDGLCVQDDSHLVIASEARQSQKSKECRVTSFLAVTEKSYNNRRHSKLDLESKDKISSSIILSDRQNEALEFLKQHKISLLFGDTGSGKTEIYMKYFEEMIEQKKRAIFLMPEISLTPQMSKRLKIHFGDSVVMWHSKLTPKQKKDALGKIYDGSAKIIAGPRSALFLPIKDLGLIVVDEEHDESYKSSSRPRYNARDIAIYMGKLYDIPVVLGSATPSLTTYVKFPHIRLKGGYFSSKKEFIYERSVESLSPVVMSNLKKSLEKKEQAILFLPTRANFKYLICSDCGHTHKCAFCSVGMSIHQKSRSLRCHYCNFAVAIPQECFECKSSNLTSSRLGTAEAAQNIREEFDGSKVEQFDRDAITTANKLKKALKSFNDREIDILVGTQMISKGHDYHGVTLAVVLGMDNMLNMSDYRAREKALSTLIQVAGRSGRKESAKVLVQSFNEEFFKEYVDKYEEFLEDEKEYRKELYPPYKKLCRVLFSHKNGIKAQDTMNEMLGCLQKNSNVEVVGFGKCAIERVADKYRFEILLRADKSTDIIKAVSACRVDLAEIDMDPVEFS